MTTLASDRARHAVDGLAPPWHDVPIYAGRDLANDDLWSMSAALAESKRAIARQPLALPRTRRFSVSLLVAAVAAITPSLGFAHSRSGGGGAATARALPQGWLQLGDRGQRVERVQGALGMATDGIFGPKTRKAVRAFQRSNGLEVDGIVGPQTMRALGLAGSGESDRSQGVPGDGLLEIGDRGAEVEAVQRALGIPADGIFGPQTRKAVRAFQRDNGLEVDGIVGPQTSAALAGARAQQPSANGGGNSNGGDAGGSGSVKAVDGVDKRLWGAAALARAMGLRIISAHRPGATIGSGGNPSDHAAWPSKAIDVSGTKSQMRRYALAVAGRSGIDIVIYAGAGIWIHGQGWGKIRSEGTYRDHIDHVHVDTF
jgi:peptidoglycan hydrolase-like protein with peptidoglycan-binding domain